MKAITLWLPWASLVALKLKPIETRTHERFACLQSERIAIHAGKRWDDDALRIVRKYDTVAAEIIKKYIKPNRDFLAGKILCTAFVYRVGWLTREHSRDALINARGRYGLFLRDITKTSPPVPAVGRQGIWNWFPPVEKRGRRK